MPPEEAERRCRRALMEAWVGRETATFALPPSRLALDPGDVVQLAHDGRELEFRLAAVSDAEARGVEAVRQDRAVYDLPPGEPRPTSLPRPWCSARRRSRSSTCRSCARTSRRIAR